MDGRTDRRVTRPKQWRAAISDMISQQNVDGKACQVRLSLADSGVRRSMDTQPHNKYDV